MISYSIISSLRLSSATSPGGVAKSVPSEATRESSPSALFLAAADSYRVVSKGGFASKEPWSNFAIRVGSGDSTKETFERTELTRALLRDVGVTNGSLERCILEVLLWN